MINNSTIASKLQSKHKNIYKILQYIQRGAVTAIPEHKENVFDDIIKEIERQSKNQIAYIAQQKQNYVKQLKSK